MRYTLATRSRSYVETFVIAHLNLKDGIIAQNLDIFLVVLESVLVTLHSLLIVFVGTIQKSINVPAYDINKFNAPWCELHVQTGLMRSQRRPFLTFSYASSLLSRWLRNNPFIDSVSKVSIRRDFGRVRSGTAVIRHFLENLLCHFQALLVLLVLILALRT